MLQVGDSFESTTAINQNKSIFIRRSTFSKDHSHTEVQLIQLSSIPWSTLRYNPSNFINRNTLDLCNNSRRIHLCNYNNNSSSNCNNNKNNSFLCNNFNWSNKLWRISLLLPPLRLYRNLLTKLHCSNNNDLATLPATAECIFSRNQSHYSYVSNY